MSQLNIIRVGKIQKSMVCKNGFEVCMHNVKQKSLKRGHNMYHHIFKELFWERDYNSADSQKVKQELVCDSLIPVGRLWLNKKTTFSK